MALSDFDEDYEIVKKEKNAVICIYPNSIQSTDKSHINRTLENLQLALMRERKNYHKLHVAFVFGEGVVCAEDFREIEEGSVCYLDYVSESASLSHLWFLGMALLEKKEKEQRREGIESENLLYVVTDREFQRTESEKILMSPRFQNCNVTPVLIKNQNAGGGKLEEEIRKKGNIYLDTDLFSGL